MSSPFTQRTQAVERALQLLDLFSLSAPELSLQEISAGLRMAPSTTHRLIKTLEGMSWLKRIEGTERYRLGPKLLALGGQLLLQYPVRDVAAPYLRRLAHQLGQTVGLAAYDDGAVVYLDCVEGPGTINITMRIGGRAPAHCVASGRALLAHLEPTELDRLAIRGLPPCMPQAASDLDALRRDLATTRSRGYAVDDGDWRPGVRAAAAAILDRSHRPVAAVTAVGFEGDLTMEQVHAIGLQVRDVATEVGRALGHT